MISENEEKYMNCFVEAFEIELDKVNDKLEYQSIPEWDSIGHMGLISSLEETFNVSIETDDIVELGSYNIGKEMLIKYGVNF